MKALMGIALGAMLLGLLAPASTAQATQDVTRWWGPTTIGDGHHLRIPVTVTNDKPFALTNPIARAQLDLGAALVEAGWVTSPSGDRDVLDSFELDLDSVRVVAMTNLRPPRPGTVDGQPRSINDPSLASSDLRKYEPPSLVVPGFLDRPQAAAFHPRTNPTVTVIWEVQGTLQPDDQRYYVVYFDTLGNRDHAPVSHEGRAGWGRLQGLFGPGPGLELVGVPVRSAQGMNTVNVLGLHPGTEVRILTGGPGRPWQLAEAPSGFPSNPAILGTNQAVRMYAGTATGILVRIEATKPVLAYGIGTGFVPSLDAGMAGRSFVFAKTQAADDTIHFVAAGTQPTTVVVQPVPPNGQTFTFTMNDGTNPLPYTVGARANILVNPPCGIVNPRNLLASPGLYSAQVTSGDPVFLQHSPVTGLFPVPAADGSPSGGTHLAAGGWSTSVFNPPPGNGPGSCSLNHRNGNWYAAAWGPGATMNITSVEATVQIDPFGAAAQPYPPPRPIAVSPLASGRFPTNFRDRPLQFNTVGADSTLYVGMDPAAVGQRVPPISGPLLGDDGGRRFATIGPALVYAPYPNTEVVARLELSQSGVTTQTVRLAAGASTLFGDRSNADWLYGLRLESTRPIIAYPLQVPGTFATVPMFLDAEPDPAEFRGHLVRLASPSGLDPVTSSTGVGVPATYKIRVTNLGRDIGGGNLPDAVDLSIPEVPAGWKATLDRTSLSLASQETQDVTLVVTPLASAGSGSLGVVNVVGTSRGNPAMKDLLGTVTYVKRSFDVGIWFGDPTSNTGTKALARGVPSTGTEYPVVVQNQGSVPDVVRLEMTSPAEGWQATLLRGGQHVSELPLGPNEKAGLVLRVVPPAEATDGLLVTTVTARSVSSPAAIDRVTATSTLRTPSDLGIEALLEQGYVLPGREVAFPLVLSNDGGAAEVDLRAALDALPGWTLSGVYFTDPLTGERTNLTTYSIGAGETFPFTVAVRAPAGALHGDTLGLRFAARDRDGGRTAEAFLYAVTAPSHQITPFLPPLPVAASPGVAREMLALRLQNSGNLDEQLQWHPRDLPSGWILDGPGDILLPRGATQSLVLNLSIPQGQAAGEYPVLVDLVSADGNLTTLTLGIAIGKVASLAAAPEPAGIAVQPGQAAILLVPVQNTGNAPLEVRVEPHPTETWAIRPEATSRVLLQPRENGTVTVAWTVPQTAPEGVSSRQARLVLIPQDGGRTTQDVRAVVDVGRADLRAEAFRAYAGPAGTIVEGRVSNLGDRTVDSFVVRLMAGDRVVEDVSISGLPAGGNATVRLLLAGASGTPMVLVDPDSQVSERDESNNVLAVNVQERSKGSPAPGSILLALIPLALAFLRRRR